MHHQLVGRPIVKVESLSVTINDGVTNFGKGKLYDTRVSKIADAIRAGEIEGDVYSDGEVWADPQSLSRYIGQQIPA